MLHAGESTLDLSALIGASADEKVRKRDGKQPKGKQKETEREIQTLIHLRVWRLCLAVRSLIYGFAWN